MAAIENNKKLFQNEKSEPIVFYFRPCATRAKLQPIIEQHGGKVTAKYSENAIKLANDDDYLTSDDYVSVRYIEECVKANKLLDKNNYRLRMRQIVIREDSNDVISDISTDDEHQPRIRVQSKHFSGRKRYTLEEDMKILRYIMEDKYRYREVSGNTLWKDMELLKVTNHSGLSMNTHFRKYIVQNLHLYDIPVSWKRKFDPDYAVTVIDTDSPVAKKIMTPQKSPVTVIDADSPAAKKIKTPQKSPVTVIDTDSPAAKKIKTPQKSPAKKQSIDPVTSTSRTDMEDVDEMEDDFDRSLLDKVYKTSTQKEKTPQKSKHPVSGKKFVTDLHDLSSDDSDEDVDLCVSSSVPDVVPTKVKDLCKFVKKAAEVYEMDVTEVFHLLWMNNGDIYNTLSYIVHGKLQNGQQPWPQGDDHMINSNIQDLKRKHGEEAVRNRVLFLDGIME